jgi:hypothetical protein
MADGHSLITPIPPEVAARAGQSTEETMVEGTAVRALAVCSAVFCVTTSDRVLAQAFDGAWTGEMSCAKLSFTRGPLKVPIDLTVSGGMATYSKDVLSADGSRIIGTEEGTGTVAAESDQIVAAMTEKRMLRLEDCTVLEHREAP